MSKVSQSRTGFIPFANEVGRRERRWNGMNPVLLLCFALMLASSALAAEDEKQKPSPWLDYLESDFPFASTVLDARELDGKWDPRTQHNLTPRGITIRLGAGIWTCFDPDLLRLSLVWKQETKDPFELNSLAAGSYHDAGRKVPGGQSALPKPLGTPILANGIYPGWFASNQLPEMLNDPRPAPPDADEVGRGALNPQSAQFLGLTMERSTQEWVENKIILHYRVGDADIKESYETEYHPHKGPPGFDTSTIYRVLEVSPHKKPLVCVHGFRPDDSTPEFTAFPASSKTVTQRFKLIAKTPGGGYPAYPDRERPENWKGEVPGVTRKAIAASGPYAIDSIPLPIPNPWKRNVRLAGIDFFPDGRAAVSTFDGDVWIVSGLDAELKNVRWKRFASGLNEPLSLQIVDNQIYVFDRTCIWRLHDKNNDGEAEYYENFCNLVDQTAETREFANDLVKKPGGGFYIAHGGQVDATRGRFNGTVVEISPDGKAYTLIASGLRQPYLGIDPKTGVVTASDQQGNWVPATPIHLIERGQHYGFLPGTLKNPTHPQPIREPLVWIPHFVNQSGATQITNHDSRFGPLSGKLLHLGFNRPEIFRVYQDGKQGAVASVLTGFDTGPLKMAVNPADGQLYVAGFKIWGTVATEVTGFYRVRYTGQGVLEAPEEVRSSREGVLLRFGQPVDEAIAKNLGSYQVDRWNYQRTAAYGSGHYKLDGTPGQETMSVSSVYLSEDKRSVFLGIPDMKPVNQMRVTYRFPTTPETPPPPAPGQPVQLALPTIRSVYLTLHELPSLELASVGFGNVKVDLTPRHDLAANAAMASKEEGEKISVMYGCVACHSIDGTKEGKVGPTWLHLYGSKRKFTDGTEVKVADEEYCRESILDPARKVTEGYGGEGVGMPSYLGVLQDYQIDSVILYLKSLEKKKR